MKKIKDKLDELESERLSRQYQVLFDEIRRKELKFVSLAEEEERRVRIELAGLSKLEQLKRLTRWKKDHFMWLVYYYLRYLSYTFPYEIVTPEIELQAIEYMFSESEDIQTSLVSEIVKEITDENKAAWVKDKLDRLESFQSMKLGTQYVQSLIVEKIDGSLEDARRHGIELHEFPEEFKSKQVKRLEDEYGPLKSKLTGVEAKILDFIWSNAESRETCVWERISKNLVYEDEQERAEYFKGYAKALEREYDTGEDSTNFILEYVTNKISIR